MARNEKIQQPGELDPEIAEQIVAVNTSRETEKAIVDEWKKQQKEMHSWIEVQKMSEESGEVCSVIANGVRYDIPFGMRVPVPESVVNNLRDARVESDRWHTDQTTGQRERKHISYQRFPFPISDLLALTKWLLSRRSTGESSTRKERY